MSAGTGLRHSEYNPSQKHPTHLLQIWLTPRAPGGDPNYQELAYTPADTANQLKLLASPDGAEKSMYIRQSVRIYTGRLASGQRLPLPLAPSEGGWLQLVSGGLTLPSAALAQAAPPVSLQSGDAVALEHEPTLAAIATADSEFLWFVFT
jgi:redox-sensitive bicupin YhaK (pirin superfamily)